MFIKYGILQVLIQPHIRDMFILILSPPRHPHHPMSAALLSPGRKGGRSPETIQRPGSTMKPERWACVGCRYQARVYSNPQKERIVNILSKLCVNKQVSAPQPLVWIMKYEQVGVPNFDQYPCEKLKGIPHSVAHAKIGSSDCDETDTQRDAEVPRKQRLTVRCRRPSWH